MRGSLTDRPILIFGASGQVGWELQRHLARFQAVAVPSRRECDFENPDDLLRIIADIDPGLIVNAAAYTAVDRAEDDADAAMAVNATAPGVIAEEVKRRGLPLVHFSTDYVFDGAGMRDVPDAGPRPYRETDPAHPISVYGVSKREGEKAIQAVGPAHLIIRTGWVYSHRRRNFLLTMLRLAREQDTLRVVDDQTGSPTWARSVAGIAAEVLARCWWSDDGAAPAIEDASGIYHLTAAGSTTWYGFAVAIMAAHLEGRETATPVVPIATSDYPLRARRPAYAVLDNGLIERTFGLVVPHWRDQFATFLPARGAPDDTT